VKFTAIFFVYSALLGAFVGGIAALFLLFVEWCIEMIWEVVPERLDWSFYHFFAEYPSLKERSE